MFLSVLDIFFCLQRAVLTTPPLGYILLPSACLRHQLEHNPTGHQKELTFRKTGIIFFFWFSNSLRSSMRNEEKDRRR